MNEDQIYFLIEDMLEIIVNEADMDDPSTRMVVAQALMFFGENPEDGQNIPELLGVTIN
jgi:hypothetical protein